MKNKKIGPLNFLVFIVFVVILVLVSITCERNFENFDQQKINNEIVENQIKKLETNITDLQKKNSLLVTEKNNLTKENQKITQQIQITKAEKQRITTENQKIIQENKKLSSNLDKVIEKLNRLVQTNALAFDLGLSKSEEEGFNPIFQLKLDSVDEITQENYLELSRGSYQRKKEIVNYDIEDIDSWQNLGSWKFTGYTATVEECDSSPSITANNSLVTPGFTLAVDPRYWSYGSIFYIDGLGFAIAADRGTDIKGQKRGDFLVSDKKFSAHLTGQRNVWLVYSPPPKPSPKK